MVAMGSTTDGFTSENKKNHHVPPFEYTSEVVGYNGRVGSFWLCQDQATIAVPRGVSPGCLSPSGCPIYVATPSSAWHQIWERTLPSRRQDLVFCGNGILPEFSKECTTIIPHFSILQTCQRSNLCIETNPRSPSTFLHGKHAERAEQILNQHGLATQAIHSWPEIQEAAARKLIWASCMWLLCHSSTKPLAVGQIHEGLQHRLDQLVTELLPPLQQMLGSSINQEELNQYLKAYSLSIPNAIPSKELALTELEERNGVWLATSSQQQQSFHKELIEKVAGKETLKKLLLTVSATSKSQIKQNAGITSFQKQVNLFQQVGLGAWGKPYEQPCLRPTCIQNVVIVGAGIIGSSLALSLAQRRPEWNILVLDAQNNGDSLGKTTPASWAWLNANGKSPRHYQLLNQLGIHVWKKEPHLSPLVSWLGSLVRFAKSPAFVDMGGYPVEGPLSNERIQQLEPFANWQLTEGKNTESQEEIYFFQDEGCVDPLLAVKTLRLAAKQQGVCFLSDRNVTNILRNEQGIIYGIESVSAAESLSDSNDHSAKFKPADLVVVAAGVGCASKILGGLPLLHKPGQIVYARPKTSFSPRLGRILVDSVRCSHVLQRPDGSIVAGGGALETGGSSGAFIFASKLDKSLLEGAKELSPKIISNAEFTHSEEAVRPMPKDGLPVVGFLQQGLYAVVTHSGITLGPLLSTFASGELDSNVECELLDPYRPCRFTQKE